MINARLTTILIALAFQTAALASPSADALGQCFADNTTGKDRKDLAKWLFVGMSAHPEISAIARASAEATEAAQRTVGILFTRLITETCPNEMRAVIKSEGAEGAKFAFESLGKMAMQELTSNSQVSGVIAGFQRYVDKPKVERILRSE